MKRAVVERASPVLWAALSAVVCGHWLTGCHVGGGDPSVVLDGRGAPSQKVENGSAYDRAAVDLGSAKKVVLPDDAVVKRSAEAGRVELFLKKTLAFGGHPPDRMSIRDARHDMGCAVKTEEGALVVATFGEWDSHIEGGSYVRVIGVVPEGVEVEQRKGLSGEDSAGRAWQGQWLTASQDAKGGGWYGPASPAAGWAAVPGVPDRDRTAQGLGPPNRPTPDRSRK